MLKRLQIRLNEQDLIDLEAWMIDSTAVSATRPPQVPDEESQDHARGRSRGGLTTKTHMLCDANGVPLRFQLSGGGNK